MIFYFSGTGNSKYVAEQLGIHLSESSVLPIASADLSNRVFSGDRLIFVFPVYAWGVPPLVRGFIHSLGIDFIKNAPKEAYAVCTCGDDVGLTPLMLKSDLKKKGINLRGMWSVEMPNVYVTFPGFDVDSKEVESNKIKNSKSRIEHIADEIKSGIERIDVVKGSFTWFKTKVIYPFFVRFLVCKNKWKSLDKCIGCGKCTSVCPVRNISMTDNRPIWSNKCVSCMACYHSCPVNAIMYGKMTNGKGQYKSPFL